jgi:hypothetical protein
MNLVKRIRTSALGLAVRHSRRYRLAAARKWLAWYLHEINGAGMRSEFERLPQDMYKPGMESIEDMWDRHSGDLDALDARIAGFEKLYDFLMACPRSWTRSYREADSDPEIFFSHEVSDYAFTYLYQMHLNLAFYAKLLRHYAGTADAIEDAFMAVAGVINPREWRAAGLDTPPIHYGAAGCIRNYLEAIIITEGRIIPQPKATSTES